MLVRQMEQMEEETRQLREELPPLNQSASTSLPPLTSMGGFFDQHEGEGLVFTSHSSSLRSRFPAINTDHFRDIWRNKFRPINVVKLSTGFGSIVELKKQLWNVVDGGFEKTENDSIPGEIRGLAHLLRYLIVYFQILAQFTRKATNSHYTKRRPIINYVSLTSPPCTNGTRLGRSTSPSIPNVGLRRPQAGEQSVERYRELENLEHKPSLTKPVTSNKPTTSSKACIRFNNGQKCPVNCYYSHICISCGGDHADRRKRALNSTPNSDSLLYRKR